MVDGELLNKYLREGVVKVTFVKANGDERIMNATLDARLLPVKPPTAGERILSSIATINPNAVRVYDVDINAWRSFRYDSVKEIKV